MWRLLESGNIGEANHDEARERSVATVDSPGDYSFGCNAVILHTVQHTARRGGTTCIRAEPMVQT